MNPRMNDDELILFNSFLNNSENYFEYGAGGSTVLASKTVKSTVTSIESSIEWISSVEAACSSSRVHPNLVHVDIGTTGDWGFPNDETTKSRWSDYHTKLLDLPGGFDADLYFVDGRFRVACFAQIVVNCHPEAIFCIHDFSSRDYYHDIRDIAREIATASDMSFFVPRKDRNRAARDILNRFWHDPR